uniref:Maturase-like protein n=1 Tax=Solibacter usitatus (strain Ellin6076) TaxID=234267 RepID=Q021E5_SOLUE
MYENLMEEVVSPENYGKALKAVVANDGSPGVDGMTTKQLSGHLMEHWGKVQAKLKRGSYIPSPVKRKEIRKENGGGMRKLGIPTVLGAEVSGVPTEPFAADRSSTGEAELPESDE